MIGCNVLLIPCNLLVIHGNRFLFKINALVIQYNPGNPIVTLVHTLEIPDIPLVILVNLHVIIGNPVLIHLQPEVIPL